MSKRKYPRTEYVVSPAGIVRAVTLTGPHSGWSHSNHDIADNGKTYNFHHLYLTRKAAVAAGRKAVEIAEARLVVSRRNLDKKIANLNKSESEK